MKKLLLILGFFMMSTATIYTQEPTKKKSKESIYLDAVQGLVCIWVGSLGVNAGIANFISNFGTTPRQQMYAAQALLFSLLALQGSQRIKNARTELAHINE